MADEVNRDFEQGSDITGRAPDDPNRSPGNVPFDETTYYNDQWKDRYKPFFNSLVNTVLMEKQAQKMISFAENFSINLHSHNHPVPIPLAPYITSMEWSDTLDDPFNQLQLNLAMPLSDASILFVDDHGKMSPGQYIFFSQAPAVVGKAVVGRPTETTYPVAQGCFLGYVSDITWQMMTNSEGNIQQNITLEVSSFIHALQMGQYFISPIDIYDQNIPEAVEGATPDGQPVVSKIENLGGSTPFAMSMDDWTKLIDVINSVAEGGIPQATQTVFDLRVEDGITSATREVNAFTETLRKVGLRADLSGSMYYLLRLLGYPLLPATLKYEPFDINSWISLFYTHDMMDTESILLMYKKALSDEEFKRKAQFLANFFRNVGRGATLYTGTEVDEMATFLFDDIEDSVRYEDAVRTGNMNLSPVRIGEVLRIATSRDDLPPSCSLRNTMPTIPVNVNSLTAVQSTNKVSTTIWSLFEGTFDFDEEMYELFPVLVPIHQSDLTGDETWNLRTVLHPLHRNMRCIPYIVYREKPMFPSVSINKAAINQAAATFNAAGMPNRPYREMMYSTYSERVGRNQEGDRYAGDGIQLFFHPDYGTEINADAIIALNCQHSDLKRMNGVRVKSPFEGDQRGVSGAATQMDPIIDAYDAQRNGLRLYKGLYPLADLDQDITEETIGAYAERFFMNNAYENNMAAGVVKLRYQGHLNLKPGSWVKLNLQNHITEEDYFPGTSRLTPEGERNKQKFLRNSLYVYATTITHSHDVDMIGNVLSETSIQFERGVFGGQHNVLPYFKAATKDARLHHAERQTSVDLEGVGEPQTLEYAMARADARGQALFEELRRRRRADATRTGQTTGQNTAPVDDRVVGGVNIFTQEADTSRQESILRALGAGQISTSVAQALLDDLEKDYDEPSYLQALVDAGAMTQLDAELEERKQELRALALRLLDGTWITNEFYTLLIATIDAMGPNDGNPIPRAIRKAFSREQKRQLVYENPSAGRGEGEVLDPELRVINDTPMAPGYWDETAWTEVDERFRGEVIY